MGPPLATSLKRGTQLIFKIYLCDHARQLEYNRQYLLSLVNQTHSSGWRLSIIDYKHLHPEEWVWFTVLTIGSLLLQLIIHFHSRSKPPQSCYQK